MAKVSNTHPDYNQFIGEWRLMRDCEAGATTVKGKGKEYLPFPTGFAAQPDGGAQMYAAYKDRAEFPDIINPTLSGMVGLVHKGPEVNIEMPKSMEPLWEKATKDGLSLEALFRRLTKEVFLNGRYSLLPDASSNGSDLPWLAGYSAESLINWDEDRSFFVLDESGRERDGFDWRDVNKHRVLELVGGVYTQRLYEEENEGRSIEPLGRGKKPLSELPFVVIGATDLAVAPGQIPLIGVARSSRAIYRLDAELRHQLFLSGQDTLFILGVTDPQQLPKYVGAGVVHGLPPDCDAKYVGIAGNGIQAHERQITAERANAVNAGARLFDEYEASRESGKAKEMRYAAQMATLSSISISCGSGLEKALRWIAVMIGEDPTRVIVTPNLEFFDTAMSAQDVLNLTQSWMQGAFAYDTLYANLKRGKVASPESTADQEKQKVDKEMKERDERLKLQAPQPQPGARSTPPQE